MAVAVVDTTVLLARADSTDPNHEAATGIVGGIDRGDLPTGRVTDYVVLEALNWIHTRQYHRTAVETYRRLVASAGFEVVGTARKDFSRAVELFETYETPAFGDATIAAYMEREGIEYVYTFDPDDFAVFDWATPLEQPTDPFDPTT